MTTIQVSKETYKRLTDILKSKNKEVKDLVGLGEYTTSYNSIIALILDSYDKKS